MNTTQVSSRKCERHMGRTLSGIFLLPSGLRQQHHDLVPTWRLLCRGCRRPYSMRSRSIQYCWFAIFVCELCGRVVCTGLWCQSVSDSACRIFLQQDRAIYVWRVFRWICLREWIHVSDPNAVPRRYIARTYFAWCVRVRVVAFVCVVMCVLSVAKPYGVARTVVDDNLWWCAWHARV